MFIVRPTGVKGVAGDYARMFGISIQEPDRTDSNGDTPWEAPASKARFDGFYYDMLRTPAGSDTYTIPTTTDPKILYTQNVLLPYLATLNPSIGNIATLNPAWPVQDIPNLVNPYTYGLVIGGNEPAFQTQLGTFSGPDEYYDIAKAQFDAHPSLQAIMFTQTGRPDVVRYEPASVGAGGIALHQAYLDEYQARIALGEFNPYLVTTFKPSEEIKSYEPKPYVFYNQHLADYETYSGTSSFKIRYDEYKEAQSKNEDTILQIILVAEFWCAMARMRHQRGSQVDGGSFHQGYAAGIHNLIGLESPTNQVWKIGGIGNLWDLFVPVMRLGQYVETTHESIPDNVTFEVFEHAGDTYGFYSNYNNDDVLISLPEYSTGTLKYIDADVGTIKQIPFANSLPARTVGVVALSEASAPPVTPTPSSAIYRFDVSGQYFKGPL